MHILTPTIDQVYATYAARAAHAVEAFHLLTYDKTKLQRTHIRDVKERFRRNFSNYLRVVSAAEVSGYLDPRDIQDIINADEACRGSFFYPGEALETFQRHYGKSRRLITIWRKKLAQDFSMSWTKFIRENTKDLSQISELVEKLPWRNGEEQVAFRVLKATLDRTLEAYERLAVPLGLMTPDDPSLGVGQMAPFR